jgi:DNA helicase-2/ATP-dependent DNA helicase PcrA
MKIFNETTIQETAYLEKIIQKIKSAVENMKQVTLSRATELKEQKEYVWENKGEKEVLHQSMFRMAESGEAKVTKLKELQALLKSPYFGRIDFREENQSGISNIYIGIRPFYDREKNSNLIYDWRAPICNMFYDSSTGFAKYRAPSGDISGTVTLKRQYSIKHGKMTFMIETSEHVYDSLLQQELSKSSGEKMKNIVSTIQKEQHVIIRNEESNVLIIKGVAGSGKTSIALHRIAFLLYRFRETLSANDILIISPNKIFSDYISNVLPELGEEHVPDSSMLDLARKNPLRQVSDTRICRAYQTVNKRIG